jgi:F0F1-type ATP synthase assembly protein I
MSQLRSNPIREVPKRVLLISLVVTVIIVVVTIIFDWSTITAVIGFWMGVAINLINFRIIVIGSKNFLEKVEAGKRASMTPNILLRFLLYGVVFIIAWRAIGIPALLGSFVGACMVNFAFKSDGFFTMGLGKKGSTELKKRASIDGVDEIALDSQGINPIDGCGNKQEDEDDIEVYL